MATKLTRDQKQNLETRIQTLVRSRWGFSGEREDTPNVAIARTMVEVFDSKSNEIEHKKKILLDAECEKAKELLYFGTPEEALALVQKLEKKYATLK